MIADDRKKQLLEAGYKIARTKGIRKVTRASVARECKVSHGLLNHYFDGREGLRSEVMAFAIEQKDAKTLAACAVHYELDDFGMGRELKREVSALM